MAKTELRDPRGRVLRWILRTPIIIYRTPLRYVFGRLLIMLTHEGRHSGRVYDTVLTLLYRDHVSGDIYVASDWGPQADWYLNIMKKPPLNVQVGRRSFQPVPRVVGFAEARDIYRRAWRRRPLMGRWGLFLVGRPWPRVGEDFERMALEMPLTAFRLSVPA